MLWTEEVFILKKLNYYNFSNKVKNRKDNKFIYIILLVLSIFTLGIFETYRYNIFFSEFKNNFINFDYEKANNLLITGEQYNPIKIFKFKNDLTVFFDSEISKLSNEIKDKSTADENILWELNEIRRYNIISSDFIKLP